MSTSLASREDNDGRGLFEPDSRYVDERREEQKTEGIYIGTLLGLDLAALVAVSVGTLTYIVPAPYVVPLQSYVLAGLGGLLGGLVFGGKWLYHSIAKGLWHQDRRMWRFLSPWMSVGTTVGIWSLINIGFFPALSEPAVNEGITALAKPIGTGFVIGYLSDKVLAKMKELTEVLFGSSDKAQHTRLSDKAQSANKS